MAAVIFADYPGQLGEIIDCNSAAGKKLFTRPMTSLNVKYNLSELNLKVFLSELNT
jgi:hypothetical protein